MLKEKIKLEKKEYAIPHELDSKTEHPNALCQGNLTICHQKLLKTCLQHYVVRLLRLLSQNVHFQL